MTNQKLDHCDLLNSSKFPSLAKKWVLIAVSKLAKPHSPWSACSVIL